MKVGRNVRRWQYRSLLLCLLSLIYDVTPLFTGEKHGLSAVCWDLWVRVTVIFKSFYSDIDTSREIWNFWKFPFHFSKRFKEICEHYKNDQSLFSNGYAISNDISETIRNIFCFSGTAVFSKDNFHKFSMTLKGQYFSILAKSNPFL